MLDIYKNLCYKTYKTYAKLRNSAIYHAIGAVRKPHLPENRVSPNLNLKFSRFCGNIYVLIWEIDVHLEFTLLIKRDKNEYDTPLDLHSGFSPVESLMQM